MSPEIIRRPPKRNYVGEQIGNFGTYLCTEPTCQRDVGSVGWFFRCVGTLDKPHRPAPVTWYRYRGDEPLEATA